MNKKVKSGTILVDTQIKRRGVAFSQKYNVYVHIISPNLFQDFGEQFINPYDLTPGSRVPLLIDGSYKNDLMGYIVSPVKNTDLMLTKGLVVPSLHFLTEVSNGFLLRSDFHDESIFFTKTMFRMSNFRYNGLLINLNNENSLRPEVALVAPTQSKQLVYENNERLLKYKF